MKTNQLPPELVEKMKPIISDSRYEPVDIQKDAEQCAQIAVDYSEEQNLPLKTSLNFCDEEINILKQQRDELLHANKKLEKQIKRDKKISEPYFLFFDWVMSGQKAEDAKKELGL